MTGIFCSFDPTGQVSPSILLYISSLLKHRGSSDAKYLYIDGSYRCRFEDQPIDVDDALVSVVYVPLSNDDNIFYSCKSDGEWFWAVVDGCIYDPHFRSTNESAKILVESYLKHGTSAFKSLDGNFSFILYDGKKRLVLLVRDRGATKPLHYYRNLKKIAFSSEIKAYIALKWFKPRINVRNVQRFISYGRDHFYSKEVPGLYETFFEGVFELPGAHYAKVSLETQERRLGSYWDPMEPTDLRFEKDSDVLASRFLELFRGSVNQSLVDGKKVVVPLSGGLDSTFVAYLLEEAFGSRGMGLESLYSMSIVFPELKGALPDESLWIKKFLSCSRIKNSMFFSPDNDYFQENFGEILWHYEQPLVDLSLFYSWEVARHAEEQGVKTLYGAQCPRTWVGTNPYVADLLLTRPLKGIKKWVEFRKTGKINFRRVRSWFFMLLCSDLTRNMRERLAVPDGIKRYREYWLGRVSAGKFPRYFDKPSRAFGLEYKEPFISNSKIFEFSTYLPFDLKMTEGWNKYIHRKALSLLKGFPREIAWNVTKMPFQGPTESYIYEDLYDFFLEILSNAKYVNKMVNIPSMINKFRKKEFNPHWAWRIVNVELWCRVFFDKQSTRARGGGLMLP